MLIGGTGLLAASGHIFHSYISIRCLVIPQSMITNFSLVKECKLLVLESVGWGTGGSGSPHALLS